MIEIKLTEEDAIQYIQDDRLKSSQDVQLLKDYENLKKISGEVRLAYITLQKKYDELKSQQVSPRIEEDTKKLDEIFKSTSSKKFSPKPIVTEATPKLKTRLSKADRQALDKYAREKFRSNAKVSQFAMKRNLRPSTVETYINKHSNNIYKMVLGKTISPLSIWNNAVIEPNELYFTVV